MYVVSIGNSFSQDAQRYLTRFAKAAGVDIMTRNLEIGGCSLEQHFENCEKGKSDPGFKPYKLIRMVNGEQKVTLHLKKLR